MASCILDCCTHTELRPVPIDVLEYFLSIGITGSGITPRRWRMRRRGGGAEVEPAQQGGSAETKCALARLRAIVRLPQEVASIADQKRHRQQCGKQEQHSQRDQQPRAWLSFPGEQELRSPANECRGDEHYGQPPPRGRTPPQRNSRENAEHPTTACSNVRAVTGNPTMGALTKPRTTSNALPIADSPRYPISTGKTNLLRILGTS